MNIIVRIPAALRPLTGGQDEVPGAGATVGEVLEDLDVRHPGLKERVLDDKGVRRFINLYVGEEDVRSLQGLATPVRGGETLSIVPAIAGG